MNISPEQLDIIWKVTSRISSSLSLTPSEVNRILGIKMTPIAEVTETTLMRFSYLMRILERVNQLRQAADAPYISSDPSKDIYVWMNMQRADCDGHSPFEAMLINPEYWLPRIYKNLYGG